MQLTTLTQFGARRSIAELHIKLLLDSFHDKSVNHIFYLVDAKNVQLERYLRSFEGRGNVKVYSQADNDYTNFKRLRKKAKYGGDCNYDFLIRRPEVKDYFLTLHDDTLIQSSAIFDKIKMKMSSYRFYGINDTRREITGYQNILIDNVPMSDLRIGTFFFCGHTKTYLDQNYKIGDYTNYLSTYLWLRYKFNKRLRFKKFKIWLNGGFDFNIRARLDNQLISCEYHDENVEHFNKLTGFFAASHRNMLQFSDTPDEVTQWQRYVNELIQNGNQKQVFFDYDYLRSVADLLEQNEIFDRLINKTTLKTVFNI